MASCPQVKTLVGTVFIILTWSGPSHLSDCPRHCECKWKSGKESVACINANLTSIPYHLDGGTQVLDLTANNIVTVKHDEFSKVGLLNLQKIYISKCRLKTLDRYAFRNLNNLVELDLSYNVLSVVPSHVFDSIPELRELKLNGNPIQRIINNAFTHVPQLVRLELSDCRIGTIEPKAFEGLENSLEWLKLDKNRLVEVKPSTITVLESLHGLELANNPWNCSCSLRPLREWMLRLNIPFGIPPVCMYPTRLMHKAWDKLELDEFACAPKILAPDTKAHGIEGKNVTMTCKIGGVPEPNVRWMVKNRVIANLSGTSYPNGKKLYVVHLQNNASNLTILTADVQDAGVYVCSAENKAGRAEASVTLAVSRKPPEVPLTGRMFLFSVIGGTVVVVSSCLIVLCVCTIRKRQHYRRWRGRKSRRENNYEKIEMNHKIRSTENDVNAYGGRNGGLAQSEVALVGAARTNGEYLGVPSADTDNELDEEEESEMTSAGASSKVVGSSAARDNDGWQVGKGGGAGKWMQQTQQQDFEDKQDLHIPRRSAYQDSRDDCPKSGNLTSGIYNAGKYTTSTKPKSSPEVTALPQTLQPHLLRKQILEPGGGSLYTTVLPSEFRRVLEESEATDSDSSRYPDLLETGSGSSAAYAKQILQGAGVHKVSSETGIDMDLYSSTLPRRHHSRYRSCDSQASLLSNGRYSAGGGSSGDESSAAGSRRLSADSQQLLVGAKRANSYLNLVSSSSSVVSASVPSHRHQQLTSVPVSPIREFNTATPLLDVNSLEARVALSSPVGASSCTSPANAYDYHAAQLERFLEEYRSLQKELSKMKESCDSIRQERLLKQQQKLGYGAAGEALLDEGIKSILKKTSTASTAAAAAASPVSVTSPTSSNLSSSTLPHLSRYDSDLAQYWSTRNPFRND